MDSPPNWDNALALGGWDSRFATVLAIGESAAGAAVVVDPNSDGADVNVDTYLVDLDGTWSPGQSGNGNTGWCNGIAFTSGEAVPASDVTVNYQGQEWRVRAESTGWWIFVAEMPDCILSEMPKRIR